jgi:Ni/Fe-hydrogenase 1 B-type cytochrome subunit
MNARVGQIEARDQVRIYVWDPVVRSCHWIIAISILILSISGVYLGNPYLVVPGEARFHFVTGTVRVIHFLTAIAFTLAVISRLLWMFVGPGSYASWKQFVPTTVARFREMWNTLLFYLLIKRDGPETPGHNPLAGGAYTIVFGMYLTMIVTGLALYGSSADARSWMSSFQALAPWVGGLQLARTIHHVIMWLLIGFFVHHFYSALLVAIVEKNGTLDSIFSGYKWFRDHDKAKK